MAKDEGAAIVFAECSCPESIIKRRLAARGKGASISGARWCIYKEIEKEFEHLEKGKGAIHVRVSTENPIEDCIRRILSCRSG